jgi:DNA modification methylase
VWYKPGGGIPHYGCAHKTDFILYYGLSSIFNHQYEPYTNNFSSKKHTTGKDWDLKRGKHVDNMWDIVPLRAINNNINYPTQKPYKLLRRIICLSTV